MSNLAGVYDCDSGLTRWKFQFQNSILDKSEYFLGTQVQGSRLLCSSFKQGRVVIAEFDCQTPSAALVPRAQAELSGFDSSQHYIREAFLAGGDHSESSVVSLGSDNTVRTSRAMPVEASEKPSENNILQQMAEMHS